MAEDKVYQYLEARPCSNYRQLFTKGKKIRAEILYRQTIGPEPRTPEEVAEDFALPVDMVREAIEYCQANPDVLQADHDRETEILRKLGVLESPEAVQPQVSNEALLG